MNELVEKKIRDVLKTIFDLFKNVEDLIFTTYNFDPDFFTEHIIAFLMGSDKKISTVGELNATNQWIKDHGVSVYYDKGALQTSSGCITLPVYPQQVKSGVFHPKIVVVYGELLDPKEKAAYLIVSSCNLTVAGYGRNREAFSCIRVKSQCVAEKLLSFIEHLSSDRKQHEKVKEYLSTGNFDESKNIEFIWTYGESGDSLADILSRLPAGEMKVISPYFDKEGPKALLDEINGRTSTCIIPAIDGEKYNIYFSDYESLKNCGVEFKSLDVDDAVERFAHAKIITKGNCTLVGSYNFTAAALKHKNAEAALLFRNASYETPLRNIEESRFLCCNESIVNKDEIAISPDQLFARITVDWRTNEMIVEADSLEEDKTYSFSIDGMEARDPWPIFNTNGNPKLIPLDEEITRALLKHKQFSVYQENVICFKGLINEINWDGIRPEIGCESLDETIAEWFSYSGKKKNEHVNDLRYLTDDDAVTEKLISGDVNSGIDIFDNYYLVSKALKNMHDEIMTHSAVIKEVCPVTRKTKKYYEWSTRVQDAEENLYRILVVAPGSIVQMLEFLMKKEENDVVCSWLIIKYLKEALNLMPEELKGIPLFADKKKIVSHNLDREEAKRQGMLLKDTSKEYLEWIEKELFVETTDV